MEILYYHDVIGNFGDDLNEVMWKALLPPDIFEAEDAVLLGIGSIFNDQRAPSSKTRGKRVFVLGSGAGYGKLPAAWKEWNILAVRGPLTAKLINRPDLAATDAAAFLAVLPQIVKLSDERPLTLFIPHHFSIECGRWERVASDLGLTFVDPRWSVSKVMSYFARAKLVVTEAMHGAIVADTLRVPWIPLIISPDALPFKWRDWTLSMDLPYAPIRVPASSVQESVFHTRLKRQALREGLTASALVQDLESPEALVEDFKTRYANWTPVDKAHKPKSASTTLLANIAKAAAVPVDLVFARNASSFLGRVLLSKPYLSRDAILKSRLDQLQDAVGKLTISLRT